MIIRFTETTAITFKANKEEEEKILAYAKEHDVSLERAVEELDNVGEIDLYRQGYNDGYEFVDSLDFIIHEVKE